MASYFQFEESERVRGDVPLQNGDNSPAGRCSDTAQFHVQSRSVRRVPFYPGVYSTPGVFAVPLEGTPLELLLHLLALRFGGCSSSFYESASPGCEALEGTWGDPPGLSGQLAHYRGQSSGSSECGRGSGRSAGAVRIQSQPEEVHPVSEVSSSIFGYGRQYHLDDPQPTQRQIAEVASRKSTPSSPRMGGGSRTSHNLGKDEGGIAGDQSSLTTCSRLAVPLARFSPRHCPSGRMGTARSSVSVVEREGTFAKLQPNHPSSSQQDHHNRCLQLGLGGSLRSCPNNGSMAQRGTVETYQLEGAVYHLPGLDDLCRSGQEYDCTRGERQSDSGCIREQAGKNMVVDTVQTSTGSMAVGDRPSTSSDRSARSATGQPGSGCSLPKASPVNNRVGSITVVMADGMVFGAPSLSENSETEDVETKRCGVCKVPICYHVGKPGVGKCLGGAFTKMFESLFQAVKTLTSQLQSERTEAKGREHRLNSRLDNMEGQLTRQRETIADLEVRFLKEMKMKESRMTEVIEDSITKTGAVPSSSNGTEALETNLQRGNAFVTKKIKMQLNQVQSGLTMVVLRKKKQQRRRRRMLKPRKARLVHPKCTHPFPRIVIRFFRFVHARQKNQQNVSSASRSTRYPATMSHVMDSGWQQEAGAKEVGSLHWQFKCRMCSRETGIVCPRKGEEDRTVHSQDL